MNGNNFIYVCLLHGMAWHGSGLQTPNNECVALAICRIRHPQIQTERTARQRGDSDHLPFANEE